MAKLLVKELRLAAHPSMFAFALLGTMVLIPNYPYGVIYLYGCIAPFITFMYGRETQDTYYTALLPIPKHDVVKGKLLLVGFGQLAGMLFSLPLALVRIHLIPGTNPVGIEPNAAFYGFGLVIYAVFNLLFFPKFYRTAYKVGTAFIAAIIPATLLIVAMEALVHFPALTWLDETGPAAFLRQLPILLAGLAIYAGSMFISYRLAARRFQKVDL